MTAKMHADNVVPPVVFWNLSLIRGQLHSATRANYSQSLPISSGPPIVISKKTLEKRHKFLQQANRLFIVIGILCQPLLNTGAPEVPCSHLTTFFHLIMIFCPLRLIQCIPLPINLRPLFPSVPHSPQWKSQPLL